MTTHSETLLLMVGYTCNNNCIMCSNRLVYADGQRKGFSPDRTTAEIKEDLLKGRSDGYEKVEFTGGEPTVRPDLLDLAEYAKELGFSEIAVSTNGRLFSYDAFCDKALLAGINRVTFTVYGPSSNVHDAITRTPGSFEQTIKGVRNVLSRPDVTVTANTVSLKINFIYLEETGRMLSDLGIDIWSIVDLIPGGLPQNLYKTVAVRMDDLSPSIERLFDLRQGFSHIQFFDYPLCLFPARMRECKDFSFVTAKRRGEISSQVGYDPKRIGVTEGTYEDKHRERIPTCKRCIFDDECGGIWKNYLKVHGEEEIKKLAELNDCLR